MIIVKNYYVDFSRYKDYLLFGKILLKRIVYV